MRSLPRKHEKKRGTAGVILVAVMLLVGMQPGLAETVKPSDVTPMMVGGGFGVVAERPSGDVNITQVKTWFEIARYPKDGDVNNQVPVEFGPVATAGVLNAYTLQIHTNDFDVSCPNQSLGCRGWVEFGFANNGTNGELYIKYWVKGPPGGCGNTVWTPSDANCYWKESVSGIPNTPLDSVTMPLIKLTAGLTATADSISFQYGTSPERVLTRAHTFGTRPTWKQVEFNVFGYGEGAWAMFPEGAEFDARSELTYDSPLQPICREVGFSPEFSNLYFMQRPRPKNMPGTPGIIVRMKQIKAEEVMNQPVASSPCGSATTVGDTHERTFAGLTYDFQATGDFIEAQVGTDFEVQTRKGSGGATWPLTSLNKSVGTRMGTNRIALCDASRLVVNGTTATVPPGEVLPLPGGVTIRRDDNRYTVRDQSGRSVRITPHAGTGYPSYTDLEIGLPTWPVAVRGLMGSPDPAVPNMLEGRDGTKYTTPISFSDLYNRFGATWRIAPTVSLLAPCATVPATNPPRPFFAIDLPEADLDRAWSVCRKLRIAAEWTEACLLDVAVLGPGAANTYVSRPPMVDGNPQHQSPPPPKDDDCPQPRPGPCPGGLSGAPR